MSNRVILLQNFQRQSGRCAWCGIEMSLSVCGGHPERATQDHFYNRRSSLRKTHGSTSYAACSRCNSARGKLDKVLIDKGLDVSDVWEKPDVKRLRT
jgi:hypothetical protein